MAAGVHIDSPIALGREIRRRRKEAGLRQTDLAAAANTSLRFVSEVERGKPTAQVGSVMRLLNALGLEVELKAR